MMERQLWLDRLRGLAIVLMIIDHVAFFFPSAIWLRLSITRFSLPLFLLVAGWLWATKLPSMRSVGRVAVAALLALPALVYSGIAWPDILVVYLLVAMFASAVIRRWPLACVVIGIIQAVNLPVGWSAYEPGYVVAWISTGVLSARLPDWLDEMEWCGSRLPDWLAPIGRAPLQWYVGHLWIIAAVVTWWRR